MKNSLGFISGNILKIIALITMTIDHIGVVLFPSIEIFRIIGRIAFPIFAFFIAEGCLHTKNKLRYFLVILLLGIGFEIVAKSFVVGQNANIFLSFSLSILLCYNIIYLKNAIKNGQTKNTVLFAVLFVCTLFFVLFITDILPKYTGEYYVGVDYGIFGVLIPALAVIVDNHYIKVVLLSVGLFVLSFFSLWTTQWYCLLAIPLIAMYNGQRGKYKLKYLFYVYYPAHLVVLYFLSYLIL